MHAMWQPLEKAKGRDVAFLQTIAAFPALGVRSRPVAPAGTSAHAARISADTRNSAA